MQKYKTPTTDLVRGVVISPAAFMYLNQQKWNNKEPLHRVLDRVLSQYDDPLERFADEEEEI